MTERRYLLLIKLLHLGFAFLRLVFLILHHQSVFEDYH